MACATVRILVLAGDVTTLGFLSTFVEQCFQNTRRVSFDELLPDIAR